MASALHPLRYEAALPSNRALAAGFAVSLAAHLIVVANVRPVAAEIALPAALRVVIRDAEGGRSAPPAGDAPSEAAADATRSLKPAAQPGLPRREPGAVPEARPGPGLALERYYTASEVDVRAQPVNEPPLVYPQEAYQFRVRGRVMLRVLINERGGVDGIAVLEAEPRGVFEEAALAAAQALEFTPAVKHGRKVKSQKRLEIAFDPYEKIAVP